MTSLQSTAEETSDEARNFHRVNGKQNNLELQFWPQPDEHFRNRTKPHIVSANSAPHANDGVNLPMEGEKTLLCFFLMFVVFVGNLISIASIHDRTPTDMNRPTEPHLPLRDIGFDVVPDVTDDVSLLLTVSEVITIVSTVCVVGLVAFHKHKSIVFRRFFFLLTLLFSIRLVMMNATMLPISSTKLFQCTSKDESHAFGVIASRVFELLSRLGLWLNEDVVYCGNYVYSGHVVILILNCLMADEYCPSLIVNTSMKMLSVCGVVLILMSGYDYTISIITAYYVTTRLFWIYHTMANNPSLKEHDCVNQICREWWYPVFRFLEGNVKNVVPSTYDVL